MRGADSLIAATAFLTRIPVGRAVDVDAAAVARAAPLYPLVGAAIGLAGGAAIDLTRAELPSLAAAALGLAIVALLTGGMHLDALADTADALGGTTRQRRLEIMRDHAIGSFGATALVLVVLVEVSLLASEASAWSALAVAAACARWAPLPLAALLVPARSDGQGAIVASTSFASAVFGFVFAVAIAVAARGVEGLVAVGAVAVVAVALGAFFHRWIGGVTGDTLGATTELAQAVALAALVVA